MMATMVTFVGSIIAIFAVGYMAGDPAYPRFFACVGLFVFSMTGLVLSNNYVVTYAFWEGVGVCSYLLIGFWHQKPSAAAAAQKAFLVNRVGDFGFAIALFWLWSVAPSHDLSYDNILNLATIGQIPHAALLGISLLLFWAATAKSAQTPLYVWLPDAMEGPTPVSALIHAATMVTAGVYLLARSSLLVMSQPMAVALVASVGCATAVLAAAIAVTQTDLKRVMAYSTVSQLGFMFMGLGAGIGGAQRLAVFAGMFHLFTHAFFKALLFLGSGSVMYAMGHVIDMRRFRGLKNRMPITCATFAIGALSLAGIPPLAGFWSKDEILVALKLAAHESESTGLTFAPLYVGIYWTALATALLTAFYTGRAFFLTFWGPEKLPSASDPDAEPGEHLPDSPHHDHPHGHDHGHDHGHEEAHDTSHFGHEVPPIMTWPLIVLAAGTIVVGALFGPLTGWFEHHVINYSLALPHLGHTTHGTDWATVVLGTLAGLVGLGASFALYAEPSPIPRRLASAFKPLYIASREKFHVDEMYNALFVLPLKGLAWLSRFVDEYLVDGLVRFFAWLPRMIGRDVLAPLQGGLLQLYAWTTVFGLALLLMYLVFA
jgi:NADH-quinone oxidoreductase subunit L